MKKRKRAWGGTAPQSAETKTPITEKNVLVACFLAQEKKSQGALAGRGGINLPPELLVQGKMGGIGARERGQVRKIKKNYLS